MHNWLDNFERKGCEKHKEEARSKYKDIVLDTAEVDS